MLKGISCMIFILLFVFYLCYDQYSTTKQIEAISRMEYLSYDELYDLIEKIKG